MVHPPCNPHSSPLHVPAPTSLQQTNSKSPSLSSNCLRIVHGYLLAVHPTAGDCVINLQSARRALLLAGYIWDRGAGAG